VSKNTDPVPSKLEPWIQARKRHRLSHAHVQMARELGLNPKKLGSIDNHDQERWKAPLPDLAHARSTARRRRNATPPPASAAGRAKQHPGSDAREVTPLCRVARPYRTRL
jgi:hypothetical protein